MTKLRAALLIALATTLTFVVVLTRPKPVPPVSAPLADSHGAAPPTPAPGVPAGLYPGPVASAPAPTRSETSGAVESVLQPLGAHWNAPAVDTVYGRFSDWASRYQSAPDEPARAALESEGVQLAGERRTSLYSLMQRDPKRALEFSVPRDVRENFPASVNGLLETPISARGDLAVLAAYPLPGQESTITPIRRTLSVEGVDYRAFVYGVRADQPGKKDLPVNGITLDDVVALSENPVRLLEPMEIKRLNRKPTRDAVCSVSTRPVTIVSEPTPVDVGGQIAWICRYSHAEILNEQLQLAANQPGTGLVGDGGLAESPYTEGRKRIIMMRVAFSNVPTPDVTSNSLVTVHAGVNSFWRTSSYGKTELAALGAGSDIVQINLSTPSTAYDGDAGALRSAVRAQAGVQGIDLSKYDLDVIYTGGGRPQFDFGGLGFIGSPGAWVVGGSTSISCHELGHNLGNPHANFWDTGGRTAIGTGDNEEYGDPYDVMGGGSGSGVAAGHYVAKFKWRIGWLSDTDFPRITASGNYRIYAHDFSNSSGLRGVRITKDASLEYFLEFRQLYSANPWMMDGIGLRWGSPSSWSSQIIDTTPGSANGKDDANIAVGRTFSDTAANVHITPVGKGHTYPESMDVVVTIGPQGGNQPPMAIVSASTVDAAVGQPITFTATATDPNNDKLAYYWEFSDNPNNVSLDNRPVQTVSFGASGEYTARCVVSDMRGGTAQQTIVVRVGGAAPFRISGHVVDNLNRPLSGILVTASGPVTNSVFSDSDGSYTVTALSAGNYAMDAKEIISGSMTFLRPYFSSPVLVGPSFTTADFVGLPGNVNAYTPLVPKITTGWRYNDTGTDLGTSWRALAFNDASWASGTAPLGYPSGTPITTVVGFGPNSANKYPTTYFRKQFNVPNPAIYTNLLVELLRDDGAVVYLNGTEIARDNMPNGNIVFGTPASSSSNADAYRPTTIPATGLVAGNNVLAVEVHQANPTSSDIVMDVGLSGLSVSNVTGLKLAYLVEPANGARITSPATVNLRANVLTGGAPVTRVEYYADGVKVAESSTAPFLSQWVNPPDGAHTLNAVVILTTGQMVTPSIRAFVGPPGESLPSLQLIAANAVWKYAALATPSPATWPTPGFSDVSWPSGPAELGFGDGDEATVVPGGPSTARFTTIYFRRAFVIEDPSAVLSLNALLKRDDGAVIYLNGVEVARDNMPAGPVTYATLAASADDDGESVFSHTLPFSGLVHGTNMLAVEVHQSSATSSDLSFELSLSALLRTNRTRGCWVVSPSADSTVDLPGTINLAAEVVAGGSLRVSKVEFYADGIKLGEDLTIPFTFAWVNPPAGSHALTAVATDNLGQTIPSAPINVSVTPPALGSALISFGDVWKYRDDGANLGSSWTGRLYDDRAWMSGAAKLGYSTPSLTTTVSFGPDANDKHITTYFRRAFLLPSISGYNGLLLRLVRDDAAAVYLNGVEIYRDNLQSGLLSWNSTALTTINSPADTTPVDVMLPLTGLLNGSNVVSVEVHQVNATSSDLAFNLSLLALVDTNATSGLYLASPAQNARFYAPATVPLSPFIAGAVSGPVEFFANGAKVGESSVAPYGFNWNNPAVGSYTVLATATVNGVPSTSPSVSILVASTPPPVQPVYQTILSRGTGWKYLDSASAPGPDWNKPAYNDATWPTGVARFGYGLDGEATVLTAGRTTHYFRRWVSVPNPVLYSHLIFQLIRDDGAVVYVNGMEVFRDNMPNGPVNSGTPAEATINTPDETIPVELNLPSLGSGLLTGSNLVAVELHQSAANSSDAGFDLALYGSGTTEPRVYIGSPVQASAVTYGRTLPIEAFASAGALETVARVQIFLNGAEIGNATAPPYRVDWTFTEFGSQTIRARMTTTGGSVVDSDPVSFTVTRELTSTQLIAAGTTWKYLDDGSNLGTSANPVWALPSFNDSAWPTASARFGYGGDGEITTLRETRTDTSRIITFYFRKSFTVQPGAVYTNLFFNLLRDDGAVVYLNGREVFRSNMPAGTIGFTTLSPTSVGGADEQTFFPTTLTVTNLPVGNNVVAVEVHQQATSSSDVGFDLSFQASGYVEDNSPPRLEVRYRDGLVELSWPATFVGWRVYGSIAASGAGWIPIAETPFVVSGKYVVAITPTAGTQFYRLGKP